MIVPASAAAAQEEVNFAVLLPGVLPSGCRAELERGSLRREGPPGAAGKGWYRAGTCSFVFHIAGAARRLRCKQYLYDLGPLSALDHAALYDHYAWRLRAAPLDADRLAWLGTDYARMKAASFLGWGTSVELRVRAGRFSDAELLALCRGMRPAPGGRRLLGKPFAELSYWSRHPRHDLNMCSSGYRPPSSLWRLRWPWAAKPHRWSTEAPFRRGRFRLAALRGSWRFDSACRFPGAETQALFYPADGNRHHTLWVREFPAAACPLRQPAESRLPEMDRYSGLGAFPVTVLSRQERRVFIASVRKEHGPHDAVWWEDRRMFLVQQSSRVGGGVAAFAGMLGRLLGARLSVENGGVF